LGSFIIGATLAPFFNWRIDWTIWAVVLALLVIPDLLRNFFKGILKPARPNASAIRTRQVQDDSSTSSRPKRSEVERSQPRQSVRSLAIAQDDKNVSLRATKRSVAISSIEKRLPRRSFYSLLVMTLILLFALLFGVWRYQVLVPKTMPQDIWFYNGQEVTLQGIVSKEPDIRINNVKYSVKTSQLKQGSSVKEISGNVLVTTQLYPRYDYGDRLEIKCKLQQPEPFEGFSYDRYSARHNIYSLCFYPVVNLIENNQGNKTLAFILLIKQKLQLLINRNLPEPQASILSALILGSRKGIPDYLFDKFAITGTAHLIAISGMHIAIIISLLASAFYEQIGRKRAFWLITGLLIIYNIVIGFPASAVRASIMGWLILLAQYVGRLNRSAHALLLVASAMIWLNPKIILDDVGFQLSFLAVLGIIKVSPWLERRWVNLPDKFGVKTLTILNLSAQAFSWPILFWNFGRVSLIGPVVNLLVLPVLPFLMIFSFVSLVLTWIHQIFIWPSYFLLTYLIKVIEIFASLPFITLSL